MPTYEYLCRRCGPFEQLEPMSRYDRPVDCPACGSLSPRVILTAPRLATMETGRRAAFETNERSAHAPHHSTAASRAAGHGPGCSCCGTGRGKGRGRRRTARGKDGSKSFPSARPWMISH